jgi:hypothetical protein
LPIDPLPIDPLPIDPLPIDPLPIDPPPIDPLPIDLPPSDVPPTETLPPDRYGDFIEWRPSPGLDWPFIYVVEDTDADFVPGILVDVTLPTTEIEFDLIQNLLLKNVSIEFSLDRPGLVTHGLTYTTGMNVFGAIGREQVYYTQYAALDGAGSVGAPEPTTIALLVMASLGISALVRRRAG